MNLWNERRDFLFLLLIFVIVALAYSASVTGEAFYIDDRSLLDRLSRVTELDFRFIRGGEGLYYRPVMRLSYQIDALLGFGVMAMHAENVILHAFNALLLVLLLRQLLVAPCNRFLPWMSGLLWGLHPITTESVCWISGRSDVLAATFVLLSLLGLLYFSRHGRYGGLVVFLLCFPLAVLTKEVMLPAVLLAVLLLGRSPRAVDQRFSLLRGRGLFYWLAAVTVAGIVFLRLIAFNSTAGGIGATTRQLFDDPVGSLLVCLRALGFYFAKLIQPFPLNFAIMEVDPRYALLGAPLAAVGVFLLLRRRDSLALLFVGGLALLAPAFLIAFGHIAWTPYAERYLYLPGAFMLPGLLSVLHHRLPFGFRLRRAAVVLLVAGAFAGVFQRSLVWRSNEALIADTARKAPCNKRINYLQAGILLQKKQYGQARAALERARLAQGGAKYDPDLDILAAKLLYEEKKDLAGALDILRAGAQASDFSSKKNLTYLIEGLQRYIRRCAPLASKPALYDELAELHHRRFRIDGHWESLYQLALLEQQRSRPQKAAALLRQILRASPADSPLAKQAHNGLQALRQGVSVTPGPD